MSFITKLRQNLEDHLGLYHFSLYVIGSEAEFSLQNDYFYSHYFENFLDINSDSREDNNVILIVGCLNWNQVNQVKELYDKLDPKKRLIVHIKSGLRSDLEDKSYFICHDLTEHFKIDYTYNEYPYNLKQINSLILKAVRGEAHG